ncbi:unnamed protein product [Paramecium sonneborni]|uniref:Uncharacterized protein n=1 Tax=Paramecium sonneborni TaxID=65129 RepID=A0A8S1RM77_9CILI|nr:unnamed protein product [Paramecium sonneborni]
MNNDILKRLIPSSQYPSGHTHCELINPLRLKGGQVKHKVSNTAHDSHRQLHSKINHISYKNILVCQYQINQSDKCKMFLIKFYNPDPNSQYILQMKDLNMLNKNNDKLYSLNLIP